MGENITKYPLTFHRMQTAASLPCGMFDEDAADSVLSDYSIAVTNGDYSDCEAIEEWGHIERNEDGAVIATYYYESCNETVNIVSNDDSAFVQMMVALWTCVRGPDAFMMYLK